MYGSAPRSRVLLVMTAVGLCMVPCTASAGDNETTPAASEAAGPDDQAATETEGVEQARQHFKRGVELFQSGDFVGALEQFEQADRAHHAPAITYNIGRARESLGQAQQAVEAYEAYLGEAGASAEYSGAATIAIAQIKARSTRLRIESDPPGATVRIDGLKLSEATPTTALLLRGHHRVSLELGQWRDGRDYEAAGGGVSDKLSFVRPAAPAEREPPPVARPAPIPKQPRTKKPRVRKGPVVDGLMGGVGLTLSGFAFVNDAEERDNQATTTSDSKASGIVFGLGIDVGYALSDSTALVGRGFYAAGSAEKEVASLGAGGLLVATRISRSWWFGAGIVAGASRAHSDATERPSLGGLSTDSAITYRTNLAVGPMLELTYALGQSEDGQWIVSLQPGTLFTTESEQSTLIVPLVIGYRWF